jgi:RNA polymerase sigma factor (sigma-70 family)
MIYREFDIRDDSFVDEVLSTALFKAWQQRHTYDKSIASERAWFIMIAKSVARTMRRKARRLRETELVEQITRFDDSVGRFDEDDREPDRAPSKGLAELEIALKELPLKQRAALYLYLDHTDGVSGAKYADAIGEVLGMKPGTVRITISRVFVQLRAKLRNLGNELKGAEPLKVAEDRLP